MTTEPQRSAFPSEAPFRHRPAPRDDGEAEGERGGRGRGPGGRHRGRRRAPAFTPDEVLAIDYKDVEKLRKLISERGKIDPRRKTGLTAKDQRKLSLEIKRARFLALLPYTAEHMRVAAQYRALTRPTRAPAPVPPVEPPAPVALASVGETAAPAEAPLVVEPELSPPPAPTPAAADLLEAHADLDLAAAPADESPPPADLDPAAAPTDLDLAAAPADESPPPA